MWSDDSGYGPTPPRRLGEQPRARFTPGRAGTWAGFPAGWVKNQHLERVMNYDRVSRAFWAISNHERACGLNSRIQSRPRARFPKETARFCASKVHNTL